MKIKHILSEAININKDEFKKILFYDVLFFIGFFVIMQLFSVITKATLPSIADITSLQSEQALGSMYLFLFEFAVLTIVLVYTHAFFENKIWKFIFKGKTTFGNTSKFLIFNLLLFALVSIFSGVFFLINIYLTNAKWPILGSILFSLALLFSVYLLYVGRFAFAKTYKIFKSIKEAFVIGTGRFDLTFVPIIITFLVFFAVNLALLLFNWLPDMLYTLLLGVAFAAFLAWFRIYLSNSLKSVKL